jgi:transposase
VWAKGKLAALRDDKTLAQPCQEFDPHANQIAEWKRQPIERAVHALDGGELAPQVDLVPLPAKLGQLTSEYDFLERAPTRSWPH